MNVVAVCALSLEDGIVPVLPCRVAPDPDSRFLLLEGRKPKEFRVTWESTWRSRVGHKYEL